jgi:hypothetical protein
LDDSPKTKTAPNRALLDFFMCRLLPAGVAELLCFHPFGMLFFVLGRGVIAILAIPALQSNDVAHKLFSSPPLRSD